jgi:UrcA family protein
MNSTKIKGAWLAITASLIVISTTAYAEKPPVIVEGVLDVPTAHVSYSDLNLQTPAGVHALQARVRRAASTICLEPQVRELPRVAAGRNCFNTAMTNAQEDIQRAASHFGTVTVASQASTIVVSAAR